MNSHPTINPLSFVTIVGEDSIPFLQRTLSADTTPLAHEKAIWANLLSPVGRILFTFLIFPIGNGLWLQVPKAQAESLKSALQKLVLTENLRIDTHHQMTTTYLMPHAEPALEKGTVQRMQRAVYIKDPRRSELGAQLIHLQDEDIPSSLFVNHDRLSPQEYQFLTYKYGVVEQAHFANFRPFLPVEIGHQHYKAIDFHKGCFIGQEVNARIHLKSKLRKYLHGGYCSQDPLGDISYPYEIPSVDSHTKIRIIRGMVRPTGEWAGLVLVEGPSSPASIALHDSSILLTPRLIS